MRRGVAALSDFGGMRKKLGGEKKKSRKPSSSDCLGADRPAPRGTGVGSSPVSPGAAEGGGRYGRGRGAERRSPAGCGELGGPSVGPCPGRPRGRRASFANPSSCRRRRRPPRGGRKGGTCPQPPSLGCPFLNVPAAAVPSPTAPPPRDLVSRHPRVPFWAI